MKNIKFNGIKVHPSLEKEKVTAFFEKSLTHFNDFELVDTDELELENYILKIKRQED